MVSKLLEKTLNRLLLMCQFLAQNSRQNIFKNCFPQGKNGGEKYDLLNHNSIRKYEDYLELRITYVLYDL